MTDVAAKPFKPLVVMALGVTAVATLGSAATDLGPWYQNLKRPWWQPPDWLFVPAWTFIFALVTMSCYNAWLASSELLVRLRLMLFYILNGALNVMWNELFFGLKRPDWALAELVVLWVSIVMLIAMVKPYSRMASMQLLPYLAWVTFAGFLNLSIVQLNGPF